MSKYNEQFKQRVIERYLTGEVGSRTVAQEYGVDASTVRKWVAGYQIHGKASIQKKYGRFSAQYKLSVLQHMKAYGLSHRETAAVFDIRSIATVGIWERQYHDGGLNALSVQPRGRPKKMPDTPKLPSTPSMQETRSQQELLDELSYLRMENAYLKKLHALIQADKPQAPRKKRK